MIDRPADNLISRLRRATRPVHSRLDSSPVAQSLLSPTVSKNNCAVFFSRLLPVYESLEQPLNRWVERLGLPLELQLSERVAWLHDDLRALDLPIPKRLDFEPPLLATPGDAWGALYVLEGSASGARVLEKRLGAPIGLSDGAGGRFLSRCAAWESQRWERFQSLLNEAPLSDKEARRAEFSATELMTRIAYLMDRQTTRHNQPA